jgi:O-antigen/teichoic acid export membrane protein
VVLGRLLAPADFGLMAVVGAMYAIASLFVDLGMSNALIHFPEPSRTALSTLYWLNLAAAALVMVIFSALAWPLSLFYQQSDLMPAMVVLSLVMPLSALGQQFCVMAEKELRFAKLAVIEFSAGVTGFAAAVVAAVNGAGFYALIAGGLVAAGSGSLLAWLLLSKGIRPTFRFDLREVKPYLRYGTYRLGDGVLNNLQSQADLLIGGAVAGSAAMGFYSMPRSLTLQVSNTVVNPVVTRVTLPIMARLQGDMQALRSVYLQTLRMTASVNFPVYAALVAWADEIVAVLLGDQWRQSGDFLRLFALWGLVRSTGNPVGSLLYATGRVRSAFWWNLGQLLVVPGFLWAGATAGGTHGLVFTMIGVQLAGFYPAFRLLVYPACRMAFREFLGAFLAPLAAACVAAAVGYWASTLISSDGWERLALGAPVFALTYMGASFIINRPWIDAMVELLAPALRRNP